MNLKLSIEMWYFLWHLSKPREVCFCSLRNLQRASFIYGLSTAAVAEVITAYTRFVCDEVLAVAAVLRPDIKDILHIAN
jgi:hypothetical protein